MSNVKWTCQECGKRFRSVAGARNAADNGCPRCGGVDIDLGPPRPYVPYPPLPGAPGYHGEEVDPLRPHPRGCSCGSPDCPDRDTYLEASE